MVNVFNSFPANNAFPRLLDFPEVYREVMICHKTRRI